MWWRSLFRRCLLLAVCAGVGAASFFWVRHRPRCVIEGDYVPVLLNATGDRLLTLTNQPVWSGAPPVQVWDTHTGRLLFTFLDHAAILEGTDDNPLVASHPDGRAHVIDWPLGREKVLEVGPVRGERGLQISPKGTWLIADREGGSLTVFEIASGRRVLELDNPAVFTPDDKLLLFQRGQELATTVWDLHTGRKIGALPLADALAVAPDSRSVVMAVRNEADELFMQVWALPDCVKRFQSKHEDRDWHPPVFSSDGRRVAMLRRPDDRGFRIEMLDLETGRVLMEQTLQGECDKLAFARDAACLATGESGKPAHVTMFDASSGRQLWKRSGDFAFVRFAGDACVIQRDERQGALHVPEGMEVLDARTGEARAAFHAMGAVGVFTETRSQSPFVLLATIKDRELAFWEDWLSERWPELFEWGDMSALVLDAATGRVLYQRRCDPGVRSGLLSDDGAAMLLTHTGATGKVVMRVWNVHAGTAWTWSAASVVGTVLTLVLLRGAVRRLVPP